MNIIALSTIGMGGLAAALGFGIYYISKKFHVATDPKVEEILALLPGANCGSCGYAGCADFAQAVADGRALPTGCAPGKANHEVMMKALGLSGATQGEHKIATVHCVGGNAEALTKGKFIGLNRCNAAVLLAGGHKSCQYGCLGFGDCLRACAFDAIEMTANGLPKVNAEKCTACGKCVEVCPRRIINLTASKSLVHIGCSSKSPAKDTVKVCKVGCIGCGACARACPKQAIIIVNNLAVIDYSKCISCGICVTKCPRHCIYKRERMKPSC